MAAEARPLRGRRNRVGPRRIGRGVGVTATVAVLAAGAVGVGREVLARPPQPQPQALVATGTARVSRGTVTERVQVPGELGYDGGFSIGYQGPPGVLTSAAAAGSTVDRGGPLYAVANQPTRLLLGTVPAYRGFASGMPDGPDVAELEQNLAALGMQPGTVDEHFSSSTAAAIRRWQATWGLPAAQRTGALPFGSVTFSPAPVRVADVATPVGGMVDPGTAVLSVTSSTRVVSAQVSVDQQRLVHVGDQVQVSLTGLAPVQGSVTRVGRVAVAPSQGSGGGPGQPGTPTVTVTIAVTLPAEAADLDQAPVLVAIATQTHRDVLLVPVVALLARPGGGYQVRLADGRYVQVQPGLFDSTASTVEVAGELTVGEQVQVPAS
jgi:peptidoglycan hydrolase-like protein with peptidoglycan-binding domain